MTIAQLSLLAALGVLLAVFFLIRAVRELRGRTVDLAKPPSAMATRIARARAELPEQWQKRQRALTWTAAAVTVTIWVATRVPMQGLVAGAVVLGLPYVLHPDPGARQRIARLEALAQWLNRMAGIHTAGIALSATIRASAKSAPAIIAEPVHRLDARLRAGMAPQAAFRLFADDFADGTVDHIVLLFQSHAVYKGAGLSKALEALARSLNKQATDARDIESEMSKVRKSSRVTCLVIFVIVVAVMLNPSWSAWYSTFEGQVALVVLSAFFVFTIQWLRRLATAKPVPRLLDPLPARALAGSTQGKADASLPDARSVAPRTGGRR